MRGRRRAQPEGALHGRRPLPTHLRAGCSADHTFTPVMPAHAAACPCPPFARRDSFSIDGLYLADRASGQPRTGCGGKGPLVLADLAAAGLSLDNVACAFQNYDRAWGWRDGCSHRGGRRAGCGAEWRRKARRAQRRLASALLPTAASAAAPRPSPCSRRRQPGAGVAVRLGAVRRLHAGGRSGRLLPAGGGSGPAAPAGGGQGRCFEWRRAGGCTQCRIASEERRAAAAALLALRRLPAHPLPLPG